MDKMIIQNTEISVRGRFPRIARLRNEWYDFVKEPATFINELKHSRSGAQLFTFLQEPHDRDVHFPYHLERDSIAILPISTFDHWMTKQIDAKTRNMVRKAAKKEVVLRETVCDQSFIEGVVVIYNESPVRQGMKFWHYGMDFNAVKAHLETFSDRSIFVGAYHGEQLIGFFKLTRNGNSASVMQIISKISERDRAPNDALLAKAVEVCAEKGIPFLQYGIWSLGGLGEYKIKHGFERFDIPRYFVPLNSMGSLTLGLRLHRGHRQLARRLVPAKVRDRLVALRGRWHARKAGVA